MKAAFIALACVTLPVLAGAPTAVRGGGFGPGYLAVESVEPVSGDVPHVVRVRAESQADPASPVGVCIQIDWGDGTNYYRCEPCFSYPYCNGVDDIAFILADEEHVYTCPGSYEIRVSTPYNACACEPVLATVTVGAAEPARLAPVYADNGRTCKLYAVGNLLLGYVVSSTIDWGDGSPVASFTWRDDHYGLETPYHAYTMDGEHTVNVTTRMQGGCDVVLPVTLTIPGTTTATQLTTWGHLKSLYRR